MISRIVQVAAPFVPEFVVFLLVVVLDAVVGVINPLVYRSLINQGILRHDRSVVIDRALLAGGLVIVDAALGVGQAWLASRIGNRVVLSLRVRLFDHIQGLPLAFFMRAQTGALVSRLNSDVAGVQTALTDTLSSLVGNIISLLLVGTAMLMLSWKITLAALLLFPVFWLPARAIRNELRALVRAGHESAATMSNRMVERFNVAGAQLAKLFGRPAEDVKAFRETAAAVADVAVRRSFYGSLFQTSLSSMAAVATVVAFGWGGLLAIRGELDVGTLAALVSYLGRLYGPVTGLSAIPITVMTAVVSFERVFEILDFVPAIAELPDAVAIPAGPPHIEFVDVSFRYPTASEASLASLEAGAPGAGSEKTVLNDICFAINPGSLTALVGPSGAGKTTIIHLLARLYDVTQGAVFINGVDIRHATFASLKARIGVVTQDAHLFHETVGTNLRYAKPGATDAELWEVLEATHLRHLIEILPERLNTLVGERGYRLSGGEKQRLAIARLLLKAPDVVILDEATAHLDSESEAAIQAAFEHALHGRTALVIAHRLSTVLRADQILVVADGRIVQRGTHLELLERGGLYAELYRRQFIDGDCSPKSRGPASGSWSHSGVGSLSG